MTKKELIEALQDYDDDMPVVMFVDSMYCEYIELYLSGTTQLEAKDKYSGDYYFSKHGNIKAVVLDTM